jgi:hypothetical protein
MGKTYESLSADQQEWIKYQKIFFVGTAPLAADGHVNISPKGLDSFRVLSPLHVAYQDLTGSGVETISHLQENRRIVIMFCAFEGPPKILRLYGEGEVILPGQDRFDLFSEKTPFHPGTRAFISIQITRIQDSCGYGVPLYDFRSERDVLTKWTLAKGDDGLEEYHKLKNSSSIDGLKGL